MVRWPGIIKPGSVSDAIVGPIDLYPTILEAAQLNIPAGQIVDGVSILSALTQSGTPARNAYFTWFPHLIPAVAVRQGNWKLIRRFEPHPKYPDVRELYNLKADLSENTNLAAMMPDKVAALDRLIDQFVLDTRAEYPKPNPNFSPNHNQSSPETRSDSDRIAGLVARNCQISLIDGAMRVTPINDQPFLGTAQVKFNGPLILKLRIRCPTGGPGRVQWRTIGQDAFPAASQTVSYRVAASPMWQDITVKIPVKAKPTVLRLYLPGGKQTHEINSIEFQNRDGKKKAWNFSKQTLQKAK